MGSVAWFVTWVYLFLLCGCLFWSCCAGFMGYSTLKSINVPEPRTRRLVLSAILNFDSADVLRWRSGRAFRCPPGDFSCCSGNFHQTLLYTRQTASAVATESIIQVGLRATTQQLAMLCSAPSLGPYSE